MSRYKGIKGRAWITVKNYVRAKEKDCYTCPSKNLQGINAQCGHYRPVAIVGSNNTRAWDERFIHLQCSRDNGAGQGEQAAYREHLVRDYGEEIVAQYDREVASRSYSSIKNWQEIINKYEKLYNLLPSERFAPTYKSIGDAA